MYINIDDVVILKNNEMNENSKRKRFEDSEIDKTKDEEKEYNKVKEDKDKDEYKNIVSTIYNEIINNLVDSVNFMINIFETQNHKSALKEVKRLFPDAKLVAILFSGGLDSTTLLLHELAAGNIVLPILNKFNSKEDETSMFKYFMAQIALLRIYKNLEGEKRKKFVCPLIGTHVSFGCFGDGFVYSQQLYNSITAALLGRERIKIIDYIEIATVLGDQGVSYETEMKNIYKASLKFQMKDNIYIKELRKEAELKFPFDKYSKYMVRQNYYELCEYFGFENKDIIIPIFSCEDLSIKKEIIFVDKRAYLKISTLRCKDIGRSIGRSYSCASCSFDDVPGADAYCIHIEIPFDHIDYTIRRAKSMIKEYEEFGKRIKPKNIKPEKSTDVDHVNDECIEEDDCDIREECVSTTSHGLVKDFSPHQQGLLKKINESKRKERLKEFAKQFESKAIDVTEITNKSEAKGVITGIIKDDKIDDVNNKDVDVECL